MTDQPRIRVHKESGRWAVRNDETCTWEGMVTLPSGFRQTVVYNDGEVNSSEWAEGIVVVLPEPDIAGDVVGWLDPETNQYIYAWREGVETHKALEEGDRAVSDVEKAALVRLAAVAAHRRIASL